MWDTIAVVLIGGLVISLLLPSVRSARGAARRLECLNNMKNIAQATHNYASRAEGKLPLLEDGAHGWPIALLPSLNSGCIYPGALEEEGPSAEQQFWLKVFTCPDDQNNHRKNHGLSYAANAGYGNFRVDRATGAIIEVGTHTADIDWNNDGTIDESDRAVSRATGVFWRGHEDGFRMTFDAIERGDGTSQTILLAENVNTRNWASRKTMDIAFVMGRDAIGPQRTAGDYGPLHIQSESLGVFGINSNDGSLPGRSPVPSSNHPTQVHIAFCDGRASAISESIDPRIYARLLTPDGESFGQAKVNNDDF